MNAFETITFTLPLGVTLASPIAELERAIYPQHAGLAALIARVQDAEQEVTDMENEDEREADEAIRVRDAMASALETLCDACDEVDESIDRLMDATVGLPEDFKASLDLIIGKLIADTEDARIEL